MKRSIWVFLSFLIVAGCSSESQPVQQALTLQPLSQTAQLQPTQLQPTQLQIDQSTNTASIRQATQSQPSNTPLHYSTLSAADIQSQFIGVNMIWLYSPSTKYNGKTVFNANNTITRLGQQGKLTGQWRMEGDKICSYFPPQGRWSGIPWRCDPVIRAGEKLYNGEFTYLRA